MNINLLPWRETLLAQKKTWVLKITFFSLFVTIILCVALQAIYIHGLKQKEVTLHRIQAYSKTMHMEYQLYLIKQFMHKQAKHFDLLITLLEAIGKHIPNTVYLTQIDHKKNLITLEGIASTHDDIAAYLKNLDSFMQKKQPLVSETKTHHDNKMDIHFNLTYDLSHIS